MKNQMRMARIVGYEWQKEIFHCTEVLYSIDNRIDLSSFVKTIHSFQRNEKIILSFLSREYLGVGKLWIEMINRIGINQFIIIAADDETELYLNSLNVPNCKVELNESVNINKDYQGRTGFSEKGLAITIL